MESISRRPLLRIWSYWEIQVMTQEDKCSREDFGLSHLLIRGRVNRLSPGWATGTDWQSGGAVLTALLPLTDYLLHDNREYELCPQPHTHTQGHIVMTTGLRGLTEDSKVLLSEQTRSRAASAFCLMVMGHYRLCLKPAPYPSWERPRLPVRRGQPPTFMSSRLAGRAPGLPASAVLF